MDHKLISDEYKPTLINTLLIGEAPPPSGSSYFYVPEVMNPNIDIRTYSTLPATIFYHYYKTIPDSKEKYKLLLKKLERDGIFLIDICDIPLKIRDESLPGWINTDNLNALIAEIPKLKDKIIDRIGTIDEYNITFLLARKHYKRYLKEHFPNAKYYAWKEFRMNNNLQ